jgi:hypothetical protein
MPLNACGDPIMCLSEGAAALLHLLWGRCETTKKLELLGFWTLSIVQNSQY